MNVNEIDLTSPLSQYGFDSISIIKLSTLLNETYQLAITPAVLFEYATLGEFFSDIFVKQSATINAYYQSSLKKTFLALFSSFFYSAIYSDPPPKKILATNFSSKPTFVVLLWRSSLLTVVIIGAM